MRKCFDGWLAEPDLGMGLQRWVESPSASFPPEKVENEEQHAASTDAIFINYRCLYATKTFTTDVDTYRRAAFRLAPSVRFSVDPTKTLERPKPQTIRNNHCLLPYVLLRGSRDAALVEPAADEEGAALAHTQVLKNYINSIYAVFWLHRLQTC